MSEDYLWDGSGEADPELLYLEQTLGTLRYKANSANSANKANTNVRPLKLPSAAVVRLPQQKRRFFSPQVLAIAASVLLTLLAGVIYLRLSPAKINDTKSGTNSPTIAAVSQPPEHAGTLPSPSQETHSTSGTGAGNQTSHARQPVAYSVRAHKATLSRRVRAQENEALAAAERARGEEAKNKLMMALRIASLELRDVRRRVYTEDASFSSSQKK